MIIKIILQIIKMLFYKPPNEGKNLSEKIGIAFEKIGPVPRSKYDHVNRFINDIGWKILQHCIGTKIFPSMAIAQAGVESGWNDAAKTIYGIKAIGWAGKTVNTRTREEIKGKSIFINDNFRAYDNIDQCISDYIKVLYSAPWFKDVVEAKTVEEAIYSLQNDKNPEYRLKKYATDSKYARIIMQVIDDFGLKYFDRIKQEVESCDVL